MRVWSMCWRGLIICCEVEKNREGSRLGMRSVSEIWLRGCADNTGCDSQSLYFGFIGKLYIIYLINMEPQQFQQSNLTELDLHGNGEQINEKLKQLGNLIKLNIESSEQIDLRVSLPNLQHLHLSSQLNSNNAIPLSVLFPSLTSLSLRSLQSPLTSSLHNLPQTLKKLSLCCPFPTSTSTSTSISISPLKQLQQLQITIPAGKLSSDFDIGVFSNLRIFRVNAQVNYRRMKQIAGLKHLQELDMRNSEMEFDDQHGGQEAFEELAKMRMVRRLGLDLQEIGDQYVGYISTLIGITQLSLEKVGIGAIGVQKLVSLTNLRILRLQRNQLDDCAARSLSTLRNLTSLHLSCNKISSQGLFHLCHNLRLLSTLSLNHNPIGTLQFLKYLPLLRVFSCQNGGIDNVQSVERMYGLTDLYLVGNGICEFVRRRVSRRLGGRTEVIMGWEEI